MATTSEYSDINTYVGLNGKAEVVSGDSAIVNSFLNLLMCVPRSRRFQPDYGSNLHYFLQEDVSVANAGSIKAVILQEIRKWQPYAEGDPLATRVDVLPNKDGYYFDIAYFSKLTGTRGRISMRVMRNTLPAQQN